MPNCRNPFGTTQRLDLLDAAQHRGEARDNLRERVERLLDEGLSFSVIAQRLDISKRTVASIAADLRGSGSSDASSKEALS